MGPPPAMRVDQPPGGEAVARFKTTVSEPTDDALLSAWVAVCDLLGLLEEAVTRSERIDAVTSGEADSWNEFVVDSASWMNAIARRRDVVVRSMTRLRERCAVNTKVVSHADSLVETGRASFEAMQLVLSAAADRASSPAGKHPSASDALLSRLRIVDDILCQQYRELDDLNSTFDHTFDVVRRLFLKACPVAASLAPDDRLPPGRQRSPGSVLSLVPDREEAVRILRDEEVVAALMHVAVVRNARVASMVSSSPGLGKSHWVWDAVEALLYLEDPRYFAAAERAGLASWQDAIDKLRGTRACVVTFNSASLWGDEDRTLMRDFATQPRALFLPIYLRVLWYLRCADALDWRSFCRLVGGLLASKQTTVEVVIAEALAALQEQPTIVFVEELNKIDDKCVELPGLSPGENECPDLVPDPVDDSAVKPPARDAELLDVFRHEICTWMGMAKARVAVLFTSAYFGMIYDEVKYVLNDAERRDVENKVAELKRTPGLATLAEDKSWLITSTSSTRRGSPFFILCAVELGFFDMDEVAKSYFLPLFNSNSAIRTSLAREGSFLLSSHVAAQAFGRLSGGHPRIAGFLRQQLKQRKDGPVWSTVVKPVGKLLTQDNTVAALLQALLESPMVLVAGLLNCTVDSRQPITMGTFIAGPCASWDSLIACNALIASLKDSSGTYENPSMSLIHLLALLVQWKATKVSMAARYGKMAVFSTLAGILDVLELLFDASDSKGGSCHVWEYVTLFADVALSRVRAAAALWGASSPGLVLPYDYTAVTLQEVYRGTQTYHIKGERPLLEQRYNAMAAVDVNDEERNDVDAILDQPLEVLMRTVFKCSPEQCGFDAIKFLAPCGTSGSPSKTKLVAVCKSAKFTGTATSYINLRQHVRDSLEKMPKAFGGKWEAWSNRVVLVVESNLKQAKRPSKLLTAEESSKVIIISVDDHLPVYGRTLSAFMAYGPVIYGATLLRRTSATPSTPRPRGHDRS